MEARAPLQQSCMVSTWRSSHQWGTRVIQVRGGVRSYQVLSGMQGKDGHNMRREDEVPMRLTGLHGDAWFIMLIV